MARMPVHRLGPARREKSPVRTMGDVPMVRKHTPGPAFTKAPTARPAGWRRQKYLVAYHMDLHKGVRKHGALKEANIQSPRRSRGRGSASPRQTKGSAVPPPPPPAEDPLATSAMLATVFVEGDQVMLTDAALAAYRAEPGGYSFDQESDALTPGQPGKVEKVYADKDGGFWCSVSAPAPDADGRARWGDYPQKDLQRYEARDPLHESAMGCPLVQGDAAMLTDAAVAAYGAGYDFSGDSDALAPGVIGTVEKVYKDGEQLWVSVSRPDEAIHGGARRGDYPIADLRRVEGDLGASAAALSGMIDPEAGS